MKTLVFLDSNVFIWGYSRPKSNSAKILGLMDAGKITVLVSEKVIEEMKKYFLAYHGRDVWASVFRHLSPLVRIVFREDLPKEEIKKWRGKIKEKDLEHLVTVKTLKLEFLISYDRDFKSFEEHLTPREFIRKLGLRESDTEY